MGPSRPSVDRPRIEIPAVPVRAAEQPSVAWRQGVNAQPRRAQTQPNRAEAAPAGLNPATA